MKTYSRTESGKLAIHSDESKPNMYIELNTLEEEELEKFIKKGK
jgi:hypothetical protein